MSKMKKTVIEQSRLKITALIFGAMVFIALGIWLLTWNAQAIAGLRRFNNPIIVYGIGIVSIIFFGLCGVVGMIKLFDAEPGLILSSEGVVANSGGVSTGMVPWSDVTGIDEYRVNRQKFVSVYLRDPEKYVKGGVLRQMAIRANIRMTGTPINLSAAGLKIKHSDLLELVRDYFENSNADSGPGARKAGSDRA